MTWLEINAWMERYAGVSYDLSSLIDECRGNVVLRDPYVWYTDMNEIVMHYNSITQIIEEHEHQIPDAFDNADEFIGIIRDVVIDGLTRVIDEARNLLNMKQTSIATFDDVEEVVTIIYKVLDIVRSNSDDDQFGEEFNHLNDQYKGRISDTYGVHESQLLTISKKMESILAEEDFE